MYDRGLRLLLADNGYEISADEPLGLEPFVPLTFQTPKGVPPRLSLGESEEEIERVRKLYERSKKPCNTLKVILRHSTPFKIEEAQSLLKEAIDEDPYGMGRVLILWDSEKARKEVRGFRRGYSPHIFVANPDIFCTGLQHYSEIFPEIDIVNVLTADPDVLAMLKNEFDKLPKTNSDDVAAVYYGLVPGDVYSYRRPIASIAGITVTYRRVIQNIS